jgi:hypothetical protein
MLCGLCLTSLQCAAQIFVAICGLHWDGLHVLNNKKLGMVSAGGVCYVARDVQPCLGTCSHAAPYGCSDITCTNEPSTTAPYLHCCCSVLWAHQVLCRGHLKPQTTSIDAQNNKTRPYAPPQLP